MQCGKNLLRGPEAKCLGVRSLEKKAKEAFESRKGLNGFTRSKEKPGRNKLKKYIALVSSAHCYSREKKYELQWTGKGFFWMCERKKYIVHAYFMLSNTPVWERNSQADFCILKEKETGAVGRLLQPPVTGRCWRNSSFRFLHQWSFSAIQYLGNGCLYHGHVIQEPPNCPNPGFSCSVACANGCNTNNFSVPLIISVFLEYQ